MVDSGRAKAFGWAVDFEEIDFRRTPLGDLVLRRRSEPRLGGREVYEIKLGEAFLMSSLVTAGEVALARLGLEGVAAPALDVVVGGLGLGYTAAAALDDARVREVLVIDALGAVIEWHRRGLVPLGTRLTGDPRCRLVSGDFFAAAATPEEGFDPARPGRRFHAVLLDVDHSPEHLLDPRHAGFYTARGLRGLRAHLHPGGVFALWSNDAAHPGFTARLAEAFGEARAHPVPFLNPYTGAEEACTVYVAGAGAAAARDPS